MKVDDKNKYNFTHYLQQFMQENNFCKTFYMKPNVNYYIVKNGI